MKPQDIASSYDALAEHRAGKNFDPTYGIAQHERALRFLDNGGSALDVGCGSSGRIIELLKKNCLEPEGLDISAEMLARAREKHPDVVFHQADICEWSFPKKYHFISAWDSIWHVELAQQPQMLRNLFAGLAPGGVMIFSTGGIDGPEERTNSCMGQPLYHAAPGIPEVLRVIDGSGCVCRHLEYDQRPDRRWTSSDSAEVNDHVYLIVQKQG